MKITSVGSQIVLLLCFYVRHMNGQSESTFVTAKPSRLKPVTYYQSNSFSNLHVTSGPVLIIDKKTIFIPNLNFDGTERPARFWVSPPLQTFIPDENNSEEPLKSYAGQNIYLRLPGNLTTNSLDKLGIWSIEKNTDLGHINLYSISNASEEIRNSIPEALGYHNKTADNKRIYRIPGCCKPNELTLIDTGRCEPTNEDIVLNIPVFDSNATHLDPDKLLTDVEFMPYFYQMNCSEWLSLDRTDNHGLIFNGSLLYFIDNIYYGVLPHGSFCTASLNRNDYLIFFCGSFVENDSTMATVQNLYFPFLIISTLCFFAAAMIYIFLLKDKNVHRKCFVGYSISMTVTFITLILLQKVNGACNFIGGLFIYSMINSFTWLTCLCVDMIIIVRMFNSTEDRRRLYVYIITTLAVPLFVVICSVIPNGVPDVPKSFMKSYSSTSMCQFEDANIAAFFVPIGLLILLSVISLGYASYLINQHNPIDPEFMPKKSTLKFMLIQCVMIFVIMTVSYIAWLVVNLLNDEQTPEGMLPSIILLQYMMGILYCFILFGHNWVAKKTDGKNKKNQQNGTYELAALGDKDWL